MILGYALCVFVGIFLGMMVMGICAISGGAEREEEHKRHADYLVTLLKASNEELDRWHTDVFAEPPDEDDGCEPGDDVTFGGREADLERICAWYEEHGLEWAARQMDAHQRIEP